MRTIGTDLFLWIDTFAVHIYIGTGNFSTAVVDTYRSMKKRDETATVTSICSSDWMDFRYIHALPA